MSWNVRRYDARLEVQISYPVGDWDALFDAVERHLGKNLIVASIPDYVPGAPLVDQELLLRLRDALIGSGVELLKPALV